MDTMYKLHLENFTNLHELSLESWITYETDVTKAIKVFKKLKQLKKLYIYTVDDNYAFNVPDNYLYVVFIFLVSSRQRAFKFD